MDFTTAVVCYMQHNQGSMYVHDADVYLGLGSLKEKLQFISLRRDTLQFLLKFSYFSAQFSTLVLQSSKLAHSVEE